MKISEYISNIVFILGLPPPSAHQLLQPLLTTSIFQFTLNFWPIYKFLQIQQQFDYISTEHDILTYFNCTGDDCHTYEQIEKTKYQQLHTINETKVKICATQLIDNLLPKLTDCDLILPTIIQIIENSQTGVLAAWHLFDPIGQILGPKLTCEKLLQPILKLYDGNELLYSNQKLCKMYHHSFLLRLIVRFGLKSFLEHFITPLVEAVGGYRDFEGYEIPLHSHIIDRPLVRKTSNLKYNVDDGDLNDMLSPLDDDSIADSEKFGGNLRKSSMAEINVDEGKLF